MKDFCLRLRNSIIKSFLEAKDHRERKKIMDEWFKHTKKCKRC